MPSISEFVETTTIIDELGNESTTTKSTTTNIQRNAEPDYIKLYTKMWCEFNAVPDAYRELFMQLVIRMTYCNATDLKHSQLVNTGKPWSDDIMNVLGWKQRMYQRGLKALCECGAIRKAGKGVYQINPLYAGRGEWKYNPRLNRGGIEDLVATFNFKDKTVETSIVWADDGSDDELNRLFQKNVGRGAVLKERKVSNG